MPTIGLKLQPVTTTQRPAPAVLAVLSQKGGAGKTTLTVNLGVLAEVAGFRTHILDLDPQASASLWRDTRGQPDGPVVQSIQAARLGPALEDAASAGAALTIIDTAPQTEGAALAAARAADWVLIPCRAGLLDLAAIAATLDLVSIASVPAAVVLNAVPPRGSLGREAEKVIAARGASLAPVGLGHRAAFVHSLTGGQTASEYEPQGKAAAECQILFAWIAGELGLKQAAPRRLEAVQ